MNNFVIFSAGLATLGVISMFQPIRGWMTDLLSQRFMMIFVLPISILLGWPIDNLEAFRLGGELGWQRVARIVLFVALFLLTIVVVIARRRVVIPRSGVFAAFALYVALAAASSLYSREPLQSLWKAFELVVALLFAIEIFARHAHRPDRIASLANGLLYFAFALCVMSIVGGIMAPDLAWQDFGYAGLGSRSMNGVVPSVNANTLGQLGGIVALVGIFRLLASRESRSFGDWLPPVIGTTAMVLAYSRTSMVAFGLYLVFLIVALRRGRILFLVASVLLLASTSFQDFFLAYFARGQSTEQLTGLTGRTYYWMLAIDMWRRSPWFGHGFFVGHKYVDVGDDRVMATVDSTYVETLVNLGIVGFVSISVFAIAVSWKSWQVLIKCRATQRRDLLPTATVLFIFVGFIVIRSLTASSFQVLHYNLLFVMVAMGALHALDRIAREPRPGLRQDPLGTRFATQIEQNHTQISL